MVAGVTAAFASAEKAIIPTEANDKIEDSNFFISYPLVKNSPDNCDIIKASVAVEPDVN